MLIAVNQKGFLDLFGLFLIVLDELDWDLLQR